MSRRLLLVVLLGGCPKGGDHQPAPPPAKADATARAVPAADDAGLVVLPPAPDLPAVPPGLPSPPELAYVTPAQVALGELLFFDPRLSSTGKLACASCHDPAHGFAGATRQDTAGGKPNLRRAPSLVDLAWQKELGWDGRYPSLPDQLPAHIRGQLGDDVATAIARVAELPVYRAHLARVGGGADAAVLALAAYSATRYASDGAWTAQERAPGGHLPDDPIRAGYQLFMTKAQCGVCHTPPLYTDLGYHRLGLIASHDGGRGRVDATAVGAFKTPTLRGAALRGGFFHDASAATLDAAIDWHLAGGIGQGADPRIIDPALRKVTLSPAERADLDAFVRALTGAGEPPPHPALP